MEQIDIRVLKKRKAIEINSRQAGREFVIDEIELGVGRHRKAIKYSDGDLHVGVECRAAIIEGNRVRII